MKLWLLKPIELWDPWYDKVFGFVICAESEIAARNIAAENAGAEYRDWVNPPVKNPWLDINVTTCIELKPTDKNELILEDRHSA